MKKGHRGKNETTLEAQALRVLRAIPGLTVLGRPARSDRGVDAELQFGGRRALVALEFKTRANAATAWQIVQYAKAHPGTPVVLVANETTTEARSILQENRISLIDGLGNAHVELPGVLIHLARATVPLRRAGETTPRLSGRAGVIAQALLLHRDLPWQVQALAKTARASVGLAHRVLARLEREGVVAVEGAGPRRRRRVTNPTALLDLWAEEQVRRPLRTLGYVLGQTPRQVTARVGERLGKAGIDYALTGAAAAALVAPFVTAVPVTDVWVAAAAAPDALLRATQADAVADGHNVVFMQGDDDTPLQFREKRENLWLADRLRLYADLLADPRRGREQARHLRQEVIGF